MKKIYLATMNFLAHPLAVKLLDPTVQFALLMLVMRLAHG